MRFLLFILATAASAQVRLPRDICPASTSARVLVTLPSVTVPLCVDIGPGLSLNMSANPPRLEATAVSVPVPRPVILRIPLAPFGAENNVEFTLDFQPVGIVLAMFRSSRLGADFVDAVEAGSTKTIGVTLPTYRPFAAGDVLTIVYWTLAPQ